MAERTRMFPDSVLRCRMTNWQRIEVQCGWRKPVLPTVERAVEALGALRHTKAQRPQWILLKRYRVTA